GFILSYVIRKFPLVDACTFWANRARLPRQLTVRVCLSYMPIIHSKCIHRTYPIALWQRAVYLPRVSPYLPGRRSYLPARCTQWRQLRNILLPPTYIKLCSTFI